MSTFEKKERELGWRQLPLKAAEVGSWSRGAFAGPADLLGMQQLLLIYRYSPMLVYEAAQV